MAVRPLLMSYYLAAPLLMQATRTSPRHLSLINAVPVILASLMGVSTSAHLSSSLYLRCRQPRAPRHPHQPRAPRHQVLPQLHRRRRASIMPTPSAPALSFPGRLIPEIIVMSVPPVFPCRSRISCMTLALIMCLSVPMDI